MKCGCLFSFFSIPNGPAGLLVSVNEERVHAIGILSLLFFVGMAMHFKGIKGEGFICTYNIRLYIDIKFS